MKLHGIKIDLSIISDLNALTDKAFPLYDLQSFFLAAADQAKKCLALYKEAEKKALEGLEAGKNLGDSSIIGLFQKKLNEIQSDIKGLEKNIVDAQAFAKRF
jgi:hypothetical protein